MEYSQEKLNAMNLEQLLKLAKKKHKEGRALESRQIYSYILLKFSKNKKAKNGIKLLDANSRSQSVVQDPPRANLSELLTLFNKAEFLQVLEKANLLLVKFPNSTFLNNICGASNTNLKKYASAIKNYKVAISITPSDPDVLYNLGVALRASGKPNDAVTYFKKAIKIKPDYLEAFASIAGVMTDQGNLDMALQYYLSALEIDPINHKVLFNMGNSLRDSGRLDAAREYYSKVILISPRFFEAHINLASIFSLQDDLSSAAASYELALKINPQSTECYLSLAGVLVKQGENDRALGLLNQALFLDPLCSEAHFLKALILQKQGDLLNGISAVEKAIEIQPTDAEFIYNKGVLLSELGEVEAAGKSYAMAIEIEPDHSSANFNLALNLLKRLKFKEGFQQYDWRFKQTEVETLYLHTDKPEWRGEKNKTVFVWKEQGIGDEIMFASIIPELHALCSKLIVQCDERLIPLFQRSFPSDIIFQSDGSLVNENLYDFHIPIGSLPRFFRTSSESFSRTSGGYLCHDKKRSNQLRQKLLMGGKKRLIGISWMTTSKTQTSTKRNISLSVLAQALDGTKIQLVCLQYGDVSEEIDVLKTKFGIDIVQVSEINNRHDIDDLASLIMACDEIVSTTNATVHLAGALGADVKVLLPFPSRWIWGRDQSRSYWYSSVITYSQAVSGDWGNVLDFLVKDMKNYPPKQISTK